MAFERQYQNNTYINKGDYFEVYVNNLDKPFLIDSCYVEYAKRYTWMASSPYNGEYRYMLGKKGHGDNRAVFKFHIDIMNEEIRLMKEESNYAKRVIVDHIDGNPLNNRKENLRVRTQSENNMNKRIQDNNNSGFAGIYWHKKQKMWNAFITLKKERISLGSFYYLRNALKARIDAEKKYFGEHAYYLRDEEYRSKVEKILSLPNVLEPVMISRRKESNTGYEGVGFYGGKYRAQFRGKSKNFDNIEDAINHRDKLWQEHYGDRKPMTKDEKQDKLI